MKNVIILCDGMSDYDIPKLGNRTPLAYAHTPHMDEIFKRGEGGLVKTIPDMMEPGSDVANLSVLGYAPEQYYSGRAPLEAAGMGVLLSKGQVAVRCNFVTLTNEPEFRKKRMMDYCAQEISTPEAIVLIDHLKKQCLQTDAMFYAGIDYRHLFVHTDTGQQRHLTPPHDIQGRSIDAYLPRDPFYCMMMEKSVTQLSGHPINEERVKNGQRPANAIWLWGAGNHSTLPSFNEKYAKQGAVISAVNLVQGIGKLADMQILHVDGATGNVDTNYAGKAQACIDAMETGTDFVFVHIEAPDECGHRGEIDNKVLAIERIDEYIVGPVLKALERYSNYKIMVLPDHATPLSLMTHTKDPVPFAMMSKNDHGRRTHPFTEVCAAETGIRIDSGVELMKRFLFG